jgi:hypothetical protein
MRPPLQRERSVTSNAWIVPACFLSDVIQLWQVWNGLLQELWARSVNPSSFKEPADVDVDLKVRRTFSDVPSATI